MRLPRRRPSMDRAIRYAAVAAGGLLLLGITWYGVLATPPPPPTEVPLWPAPAGAPPTAEAAAGGRTEVAAAEPVVLPPGLAGFVEFRDGQPGEVGLFVYREGRAVATLERIAVPGEFWVPAWTDTRETVQVVLRGDRGSAIFWCRHGDTGARFVLDVGPVGSVRWRIPSDRGAAVHMLALHPVVDLRGEDKDVTVEAHWRSAAMAGGLAIGALLDLDVPPSAIEADVVRYTVDGVPFDDYVCVLQHRNPAGVDAVWAQTVTVAAPVVDLGCLSLSAERHDLKVVDATSGQPIAARARLAVGSWQTSFVVAVDARGAVRLPVVSNATWVFAAPGFVTTRLRATELGAEVRLRPATVHELRGQPGTMWFTLEGGEWTAARCGAGGIASLPTQTTDLTALELVRYAPATGTYEVTKGRAASADLVECRIAVADDEGPLVAGSVSFDWEEGACTTTVSIRDGVGFARLSRGMHQVSVRVGSQVHDNDHEFYFARTVGEGDAELQFHVPGGRLRLTVLDAANQPADGQALTVVSRGRDDAHGCSWRIRSTGRIRNGLIEFPAIPESPLSVRVGRTEIACLSGPRTLTLNLP